MLLDRADESAQDADDRRGHARADLVVSGVLALIAVVYGLEAFALPKTSPNQADIGPQAYPLLILVVLVLVTLLLAVKSVVGLIGSRGAKARTDRRTLLVGLGVLAFNIVVTMLYLELMIPLGFIVSTALFVAVQVAAIGGWRRYGGRRILVPVAAGCLSAIVIYVLFADSLGVLLPRGIFSL
ncbi:tripartite tricarboxylate transporter TctB family protein [Mycolicibacterium agri]|uniref:DUF1468 domain-containing protein n=1 Tax=Mycolicibacterium agri TaxID=36811 RepID=A0A7I9VY75_MYCAG|nr:tripartite tricarboxylate transporter TctB family protein [Mycolicibacterium agri]GFG50373.1 hypothetical protein MAGR_18140 [Mycolicibacterium agri]